MNTGTDNNRMPGMLPWLLLAAVVITLDLGSKYLVLQVLEYHRPLAVTPGFNLTLTYNTGAAFSFLSEAGGWQRWFFAAFALAVSAVLLVWLYRLPRGARWLPTALALILGGALGNLYDRLVHGYVVDFIQVYYQQWYWPAFNIADSAITVGAVMLIIDAIWLSRDDRKQA
ncbi:signal peptidase II [Methylohalomonas lacus]|uniref:Lipoprotein signal peptidase n=1 Tax=Methylohalomonas lacus TaxID=398773 RepID=A0AAE3HM17_9GAMM|nr:signal peptidase II [Methylohalomonas lacus]MCS3902953.1 signal peptidase II [Methylohalomonas lacus]